MTLTSPGTGSGTPASSARSRANGARMPLSVMKPPMLSESCDRRSSPEAWRLVTQSARKAWPSVAQAESVFQISAGIEPRSMARAQHTAAARPLDQVDSPKKGGATPGVVRVALCDEVQPGANRLPQPYND